MKRISKNITICFALVGLLATGVFGIHQANASLQEKKLIDSFNVEPVAPDANLNAKVVKVSNANTWGDKAIAIAVVTSKAAAKTITTTTGSNDKTKKSTAVQKNHIEIPRMKVDTDILEGATAQTLNKGLWHIPGTSVPTKGGNIVISGHRYKWLPPSNKTFWDLDKLKVGDQIFVTWEGKKYTYQVNKVSIVTPDRVDILNDTPEHKVTLFTCTPKFTSKYRLVVEALFVE